MTDRSTRTDEQAGDRIFFWVDADDVRCSPRHRTVKAALDFYKTPGQRWTRDQETGRPALVNVGRGDFPSQGDPVELKVGVYHVRELDADERAKVERVKALMSEGFV